MLGKVVHVGRGGGGRADSKEAEAGDRFTQDRGLRTGSALDVRAV